MNKIIKILKCFKDYQHIIYKIQKYMKMLCKIYLKMRKKI